MIEKCQYNNKKILYVTDKRHQTLLFVIDENLFAGAARHVARCIHVESAFVMLRPELPEPDIPTIHHLLWQRFMENIVLCLPVTLVAHSWPQVQIIVVETYNRIESHLLQSSRSIASIHYAFSLRKLLRDKVEMRTFYSRKLTLLNFKFWTFYGTQQKFLC